MKHLQPANKWAKQTIKLTVRQSVWMNDEMKEWWLKKWINDEFQWRKIVKKNRNYFINMFKIHNFIVVIVTISFVATFIEVVAVLVIIVI